MTLLKQYSNGKWVIIEAEKEEFYISKILEREPWLAPRLGREPLKTTEDILDYLQTGKTLDYDDEWYAVVKMDIPKTPKPVEMVKCDCGHTVSRCSVMGTSTGSSCPECYDRMSM